MTLHWADLAVMVAIVVAGCGASYFLLLGKMRQTMHESHREMERRLAALTEAITMREPASEQPVSATDALAAAEMESEPAAIVEPHPVPRDEIREASAPVGQQAQPDTNEEKEISPEIQVAIAAAAIALFGNNARVRSARRIPSSNVVSPWTQQGRVAVQSSHNLRTRG